MRIVLDSRSTVEQNAARYFERSKKARKKLEGARKAVALAQERLSREKPKEQHRKAARKRDWYEHYRWFRSSDGLLCIAGRDASTNEQIVKRHAQPGDVVFHTDMAGSPFVVVKSDGREIPASTLDEAAQFAASLSRAWKAGYSQLEVFHVRPDQLSKTAQAGEYLGKGAFMVRGNVEYRKPELALAIGKLEDGRVMSGPPPAVLKSCGSGYELLQGNDKSSDVAKRLAKLLDSHPDEIVPLLPAGGVKLGRRLGKA